MRELVSGPLFLILGNRLRGLAGTVVGSLRHVSITNVVASGCARDYPSIVTGIPGHPVESVRIGHLHVQQPGGAGEPGAGVTPAEFGSPEVGDYPDPAIFGPLPAQGMYLRHVRGLALDHVSVDALDEDPRPFFVLDDAHDVSWTATRQR